MESELGAALFAALLVFLQAVPPEHRVKARCEGL